MIRHLQHTDIDKAWWDQALLRCADRLWYAQSWVLDHAAPGWDAIVDYDSGAIMPLTWRRKWGVDYLFQPFGLQQLGVFAPEPGQAQTIRLMLAIPERFPYWDISVQHIAGFKEIHHGRIEERTNQVLPLEGNVEELRAAYSQGHRRNLRNPDSAMVFSNMTADDFVGLFRRTTGERFGAAAVRGLSDLQGAITEGVRRGQCEIVSFVNGDSVVGAVCFATWEGRTILLKSANTSEGMEARAIFRILDHWVQRHAGTGFLLDFAGSMTPSVARFNAGFGAQPRVYLRLVRNLLPAPLRWLKR